MGIYELSRQATVYFIPVAKWGKEYYVICPICEAGLPVPEEKLAGLLQIGLLEPDDETAVQIWMEMQNFTAAFFNKSSSTVGAEEMEDWFKQINELPSLTKFRKEHVNRVLLPFTKYLGEYFGAEKTEVENQFSNRES